MIPESKNSSVITNKNASMQCCQRGGCREDVIMDYYVALCSLHEGRIMSLQHWYRINRDGNTAFSVMLHYTSTVNSLGRLAQQHARSQRAPG